MFRVSASKMRGTRLLNPNVRISEAAYDVGFQSLTEFNRTFKRVFGKSSTSALIILPVTTRCGQLGRQDAPENPSL